MKFTILAKDLKRALGTCNEIAPVSSSIAEHQAGVLICALGKTINFMASDETSYVSADAPGEVKEPGEALVRCSVATNSVAQTFLDDESQITVETTSRGALKISGASGTRARHNRTFPLLDTGFFVTIPEFEDAKATQMTPLGFQDGLGAVAHAASKDASKLHLNCIFVEFTDTEVVFAATDGMQVAEFRKAVEVPEEGPRGSFILGLKFANVMAKHVADGWREKKGDTVGLYVEGDNFFLKSAATTLVGALLNTDFPEYRSYLEVGDRLLALFPKEEFLSVLQSMQPTADTKSHRMVVEAQEEGNATLSVSSISGEAVSSDLKVQTPQDFTLHFDSVLLQNSIRPLKVDEEKAKEDADFFEFYFSEEAATVVLKSVEEEDIHLRTLVCTLKKID